MLCGEYGGVKGGMVHKIYWHVNKIWRMLSLDGVVGCMLSTTSNAQPDEKHKFCFASQVIFGPEFLAPAEDTRTLFTLYRVVLMLDES